MNIYMIFGRMSGYPRASEELIGYVNARSSKDALKEARARYKNITITRSRWIKSQKNPALYESFHGVPPIRKKVGYYEPPPKELITVGELTQINYKPVRGQHKNTEFYHLSGDDGQKIQSNNLILATDKEGKNLYLIKKNKSRFPVFTDRGIIR